MFLAIIYKLIKEKNFFLPLVLALIAAFILPFSFTIVVLFFVTLAIFTLILAHNKPEAFADLEFYFVTLKRGFVVVKTEGEHIKQNDTEKRYS